MGLSDFALNTDDIQAIANYVQQTPAKTDAAHTLQVSFTKWYDGLGYFDKMTDSVVQEASNRRNAFNVANATNKQELSQVRQVLASGVSREEARGEERKVDSAGNYKNRPGITVLSAEKGSVPKGARALIKRGSRGDAVKAWQNIIGVKPEDGIFGPGTDSATRVWQTEHGLKSDGIVGSGTWAAALGGNAAPNMPVEVAAVTPVAPLGTAVTSVPIGTVTQSATVSQPPNIIAPPPRPVVAAATVNPPEDTHPKAVRAVTNVASHKKFKWFAGISATGVGLWFVKKLFF